MANAKAGGAGPGKTAGADGAVRLAGCADRRPLGVRARARRFADVFQQITEESIPLRQLSTRTRMRNAEKRFHRLLEKRYLQNVLVDAQKRAVVLTAPNRRVEQRAFVQVECPNCGAKNQVVRGRIGRCAYCDSPLMAQNRKG